jgi:4-methyl-5(b-hydroxyethyl)-thiazole monophosphate biosynthesis
MCKGVEIYEAATFYDILGWASVYGSEKVETVMVGLRKEVEGTFGIKLIVDTELAQVNTDDFDALAIPGGFEIYGFYREAYSEAVGELIRRFDEQGKPIASICVGALPLGRSGILTGRQATTYHVRDGNGLRRKQLAEFGVQVLDQSIVHDKNVTSSTSPATATEVAFGLLATLTGDENAGHIRYLMGFRESGGA